MSGAMGGNARERRMKATAPVVEGEGDSDLSLDLHTPLLVPCVSSFSSDICDADFFCGHRYLMVSHGLHSPHSKLLPGSASREHTARRGGWPAGQHDVPGVEWCIMFCAIRDPGY